MGIPGPGKDEAQFWDNRDIQALVETVGRWNREIAALVGQWKDQIGGDFAAPIAEYPNFERLEAEGRTYVRRRRTKGSQEDGPGVDGHPP